MWEQFCMRLQIVVFCFQVTNLENVQKRIKTFKVAVLQRPWSGVGMFQFGAAVTIQLCQRSRLWARKCAKLLFSLALRFESYARFMNRNVSTSEVVSFFQICVFSIPWDLTPLTNDKCVWDMLKARTEEFLSSFWELEAKEAALQLSKSALNHHKKRLNCHCQWSINQSINPIETSCSCTSV